MHGPLGFLWAHGNPVGPTEIPWAQGVRMGQQSESEMQTSLRSSDLQVGTVAGSLAVGSTVIARVSVCRFSAERSAVDVVADAADGDLAVGPDPRGRRIRGLTDGRQPPGTRRLRTHAPQTEEALASHTDVQSCVDICDDIVPRQVRRLDVLRQRFEGFAASERARRAKDLLCRARDAHERCDADVALEVLRYAVAWLRAPVRKATARCNLETFPEEVPAIQRLMLRPAVPATSARARLREAPTSGLPPRPAVAA
mmetsp:Transcript_83438/g.269906  ORF Transcript_83438/g.269906 Transcript_83438/m.269906 type:complete len:255 (-) Transcript_83438:449-1213(-)